AGQPYRMCRAVLGAAADAVCRAGAARLVTPATVPVARSRSEVSEAVIAGLAGKPFTAAVRAGSEMADDMARWTTPVTSDRAARLTVRLAPPEDDGGWLLTVESAEPAPDAGGPAGGGTVPLPAEGVLHSGGPAGSVPVDAVPRDAAAIRKLAAQARPLVQTKGGWVELDKADLEAAAEALADRSKRTEMSGAEILRHAVGLEGGLGGPVLVDGGGWA